MRVGHSTDPAGKTGCTVVAFDRPNVASGEVRGGAPATREFALLDPRRSVESVDAVVLSGGSAFGLAAADGVMTELRSADLGHPTAHGPVPIVVGMSIYDLGVGDSTTAPTASDGGAAWRTADTTFEPGAVGGGTGATTAKWRGVDQAQPSGFAAATGSTDGMTVAALVVVNAFGEIVRDGGVELTAEIDKSFDWPTAPAPIGENTTIGVIATDASLTKTQCRILAEGAHDGFARALFPAHAPFDGDAVVVVSHADPSAEPLDVVGMSRLRTLVASTMHRAIVSVAEDPNP